MASSADLRNRYLDELISSCRLLEAIETAAIAEAWASSAVAEWLALDGVAGELAAELEEHSALGAALVAWVEGDDAPITGADWAGDAGRHELDRVVRLLDDSKPNDVGWIFEYSAPSGDRHDLSVTIADGVLVGLSVGPEGLASAAVEDDARGFRVEVVDASEARTTIESSLGASYEALSESAEATLPLLVRRLGLSSPVAVGSAIERVMPDRETDDDRYASSLIQSALRDALTAEAPPEVELAREAFCVRVASGDTDAHTVFEVAGMSASSEVDLGAFIALVGAYFAPVDLSAHTDAQFDALIDLEPADWAGVVLGFSRAPVGTEIDGDTLVSFVNRAPEITTTIPKRDAPRIAWAFEQMLFAWEVTGALDENGATTEAGRWLLPRAALAAWEHGD